MRYKVLKSMSSEGTSIVVPIVVGAVFIGSFLLVLSICLSALGGNFSTLNFARVAASHMIELLITGFLGAVGLYILYTVFLQRPKMYLGTVVYKNSLGNGSARMEFQVAANESTAASVSGLYRLVVEDDGTIIEGDMCIAEIKESSYCVKTLCKVSAEEAKYIKQRGVLATGQSVKTQTNSYSGFMELLFKFMMLFFAVVGAGIVYRIIWCIRTGRPIFSVIALVIPLVGTVAAARFAFRAKDKFISDNSRSIQQKPVGYGLEQPENKLPRKILVERENSTVMGGVPSLTVKNEYGMLLYHIGRHATNNNAYDVQTPDGISCAAIKYDPIDMESFKVNVFGAHDFSVRRKMIANTRSADYEIEGLDFYVHGNTAFAKLFTLDGTAVCDFAASAAANGEKLSAEVKTDYEMNLYMILIAVCISANNAREKRRR